MKKTLITITILFGFLFSFSQSRDTTIVQDGNSYRFSIATDNDKITDLDFVSVNGRSLTTTEINSARSCYLNALAGCKTDPKCLCACLNCDPNSSPNAGCALGWAIGCLFGYLKP